jgi:hypothetical protein
MSRSAETQLTIVMLNSDTLGAVYLIVFRVAIIAAGTVSIFCGYRLFLSGVFGGGTGLPPSDVEARFKGMRLTLKSAAPGTCFAFFGVVVITVMMLSAPPQFSRSHVSVTGPNGETKETENIKMRGQGDELADLVEKAKQAEKMGNTGNAIKGYETALRLVAEPLNNLAFLYHNSGRNTEALQLARLATQFAPNENEFADTLNRIQNGQKK